VGAEVFLEALDTHTVNKSIIKTTHYYLLKDYLVSELEILIHWMDATFFISGI